MRFPFWHTRGMCSSSISSCNRLIFLPQWVMFWKLSSLLKLDMTSQLLIFTRLSYKRLITTFTLIKREIFVSNESYKLKNTVPQTVFHDLPTFVEKWLGMGGGGGAVYSLIWIKRGCATGQDMVFALSCQTWYIYYHVSLS